jgi:hypothetical protein
VIGETIVVYDFERGFIAAEKEYAAIKDVTWSEELRRSHEKGSSSRFNASKRESRVIYRKGRNWASKRARNAS